MLSERLLSNVVEILTGRFLRVEPSDDLVALPAPVPGQCYLLYVHVPFCSSLCPYCSFNRFPYEGNRAKRYFRALREELRRLADAGFQFGELYVGGGTPTIDIDELASTIALARELFPGIGDVSSETNPNHLTPEHLARLDGLVQRLSVGVQSFDDGLLRSMGRYAKYGSAAQTLDRIAAVAEMGVFKTFNVDMIFNFPGQTEQMVRHDLDCIRACGASQATFYPLMVSPASRASIERTLGKVDYTNEERFYHLIYDGLCGGGQPPFHPSSCYTFSRGNAPMIDEYVVGSEQYVAAGSGGISYLGGSLYVNTFSLADYERRIGEGQTSAMASESFSRRNEMRYRFLMDLFGLELDKAAWERRFGCSVEQSLPAECAFLRACGAFARDDPDRLTLTPKGRYLMVVMMRQFFVGVNALRDQARAALPPDEARLLF